MGRAEIAALLATGYLVVMFVLHRIRLRHCHTNGPSLDLLRRFDYRALWDELLPDEPQPGAPAPCADAPAAPRAYAQSPWELERPPSHRELRDALLGGSCPEIDPGDAQARWLGCHFAIRRVLLGDLDGAAALAARLPSIDSQRMLASIDLARAERRQAVRDRAGARRAVLSALARAEGSRESSAGLSYLSAHLRLAWLTDEINLEQSALGTLVRLRRALRRFGERPCLHYAKAHAEALLGRHEEALDELGRALYFSQGDPFYARPILECPFVARERPALFAQCRALAEKRSESAGAALPRHGAGD
jgi:hypothetical protein